MAKTIALDHQERSHEKVASCPGASPARAFLSCGLANIWPNRHAALEELIMSKKSDQQPKTARHPITRAALEQAIAEVVKASGTDCEGFVGVIVERMNPIPPEGANWTLRGARFGKSNRELCAAALADCVTEKQLAFELSD
jgi:hypothetical protein